jgi:hypothetical protein
MAMLPANVPAGAGLLALAGALFLARPKPRGGGA